MKRMLFLSVMIGLLAFAPAVSRAQNLLTNGNLDASVQVGSPIDYWPEPVAWTITTDPCSYSPCTVIPYTAQGQPYTPSAGHIAGFADRLNPNVAGFQGLIGESYQGRYPGEIVGAVDVEIKQSVPGTAGTTYKMTGWAHFEGGYAGGVANIDPLSPSARAGLPSETDTFFALEFLDGVGTVLGNSLVKELHNDLGQQNDLNQTPTSRVWVQHSLIAVAPAGTVSVQVRAAMVNGEFNVDIPGGSQNVFFDDFSLTVVPEPASGLLALLGLAIVSGGRRKK
jgi:PEP-CTERM motif